MSEMSEYPDEEIRKLREENRVFSALLKELNEACGWGDESALHAIGHIKNFVFNLKTDAKVEKKLRLLMVQKLKNIIEEEAQ